MAAQRRIVQCACHVVGAAGLRGAAFREELCTRVEAEAADPPTGLLEISASVAIPSEGQLADSMTVYHLLYTPNETSASLGLRDDDPGAGAPWLHNAGSCNAHVMWSERRATAQESRSGFRPRQRRAGPEPTNTALSWRRSSIAGPAESAIDLLGSSDTVFVRSPSDWSPIVGNLARNSLANEYIVAMGQSARKSRVITQVTTGVKGNVTAAETAREAFGSTVWTR